MAPHKCHYFMCKNTSEKKSLFTFPWNDAERLKTWKENCGNMTIAHLPPHRLRSRHLCVDHFKKKYICNESGKRKRLRKTAVPDHFKNFETEELSSTTSISGQEAPAEEDTLKVLTPKKVYTNKRASHELADNFRSEEVNDINVFTWSTPKRNRRVEEDTPKCKILKNRLVDCKKKMKREIIKNKSIKDQINNKNVIDMSKHKFSSESSKLLTKMQLRKSKSKKQWTEKEKKFCMTLYYKSPSAYKFMVNSGIVLAAPSTIQRWLQETNCLPGINSEIFNNIQIKFSDKSINERACTVCFDEMSIMVDLEYTTKYDLIEGFEDFGGGNRKQNEAKSALVFIVRGIYSNWKIPIAYFLSSKTVDSDKLATIVDSVINKLFECGLLPKVTVCDQATPNVKMIKKLGATVDSPFFFINGHKIFAIFDVPHLIKNVRNNLISGDFELQGNQISFNDIINVYNLDKNNKSKSLKKLTPVHINPNNFQKMKVKLATQILSNSVASSIKTAADSGELISGSAKHTADFVQLCNDLFDCLNSRSKVDSNPYRCAITINKNSLVNQTLIKSKEIFSRLKKISYTKNNQKHLTRPPCFDGMMQTINAVQQLSAEEFTAGTGVKFMITYRLNQDVIENLFGIYRIRGGCNKNPTSKSLRSAFRSNLLNNLMKFDKTNCESDHELFVATQQNTQHASPRPSTSSSVTLQGVINDDVNVSNHPSWSSSNVTSTQYESGNPSEVTVTLETCSVMYFAGWLGRCCTNKFDCADCKNILLKNQVDLTDKKQLLLINKTYSNIGTPTLKSPSDFLFQLVNELLDFYNRNINKLYESDLVADLVQNFKKEINVPDNYHNFNHFDFLIKKLLEVKIHDYCKSRKKSLQSSLKLRILQNR